MRRAAAAAVAAATLLLPGCSDSGDLPDSDAFRDCLTEAGADPGELDSPEARADAFADPRALDCVTSLEVEEQRDLLSDVFTTEELAAALAAWVAHTAETAEDAARTAGTLAGAGSDPDEPKVAGGALDELVAVAIRHQDGRSAFYEEWSENTEAQASVPDADPVSGPSLYLDWLEGHGPGSPEQEEAAEIRALQEQVAAAREEAAG